MKVHIYDLNHETENRGQLRGILTYLSQRLHLNSKDNLLDAIVNLVYARLRNGSFTSKHYSEEEKHPINTTELVETLGTECWKNGYVIEVVE